MSTHNICFRREVTKIICGYPFLSVAMRYRKHIIWVLTVLPLLWSYDIWLNVHIVGYT